MSSPEDSRLRTHFTNLREEDRSAAPPFDRTAAAAAASSHRGSSLRIALAAVPLLVLAVMFALRTHRSTASVPHELAAWSSPTAFLLETPGKQLLNQTLRLGEPLIQTLPGIQDGPK
jgi:hypothetical protein